MRIVNWLKNSTSTHTFLLKPPVMFKNNNSTLSNKYDGDDDDYDNLVRN